MRRRNLVLSGLGVAVLSLSSGCDSTVGLDPTRTSFTKVIVPGACAARGDLSQLDFSVMLLDTDNNALVPESPLDGESATVGELLKFGNFRFALAPVHAGQYTENAVGDGGGGQSRGVGLNPTGLEFLYAGGEERIRDPRLVVLMLDHSGSLAGLDPYTGAFDQSTATDRSDQRIAFFEQFVRTVDNTYLLSLVSFSGNFANITDEYSKPVRNKDVIVDGLRTLQTNESSTTPLTRALVDTLDRVIEPNSGMNPVVVLFTDGVEDGDPTEGDGGFEAIVDRYAERAGAPIPVIVIHLQPPEALPDERRGRDGRLAELACRTGGEYIFLRNAGEFTTNNNLQPAVRSRIAGVWRLTADSTLSNADYPAGEWLLSTQLEVTLSGRSVPTALQRDPNSTSQSGDTRVWFYKE